jgi:hypothetical protein
LSAKNIFSIFYKMEVQPDSNVILSYTKTENETRQLTENKKIEVITTTTIKKTDNSTRTRKITITSTITTMITTTTELLHGDLDYEPTEDEWADYYDEMRTREYKD